jgi:ribonuclease HI
LRPPDALAGPERRAESARALAPDAGAPPEVTIYADGGANPNPGRGGYGVVLLYQGHRKELSGGYQWTTNNRMEILAAIRGLEALKQPCHVTLHSDSRYLVNAMTQGWVQRWRRNGWMRNADEEAKNPDLWEQLYQLSQVHKVTFTWVRAHGTNRENNRCDALATAARLRPDLPPDPGFGDRP